MRKTVQRSCLIVIMGVVCGLGANAVSPRRIPYVTPQKEAAPVKDLISLADAEQLWRAGAMFLDARSTADYEAGHVANSLSLPFERFAEVFPAVGAMLPHDVPIIIYCDGEQCELSHQLLGRLRSNGYQNLRVLVNGWTVWRDAGLPTVTGPHP